MDPKLRQKAAEAVDLPEEAGLPGDAPSSPPWWRYGPSPRDVDKFGRQAWKVTKGLSRMGYNALNNAALHPVDTASAAIQGFEDSMPKMYPRGSEAGDGLDPSTMPYATLQLLMDGGLLPAISTPLQGAAVGMGRRMGHGDNPARVKAAIEDTMSRADARLARGGGMPNQGPGPKSATFERGKSLSGDEKPTQSFQRGKAERTKTMAQGLDGDAADDALVYQSRAETKAAVQSPRTPWEHEVRADELAANRREREYIAEGKVWAEEDARRQSRADDVVVDADWNDKPEATDAEMEASWDAELEQSFANNRRPLSERSPNTPAPRRSQGDGSRPPTSLAEWDAQMARMPARRVSDGSNPEFLASVQADRARRQPELDRRQAEFEQGSWYEDTLAKLTPEERALHDRDRIAAGLSPEPTQSRAESFNEDWSDNDPDDPPWANDTQPQSRRPLGEDDWEPTNDYTASSMRRVDSMDEMLGGSREPVSFTSRGSPIYSKAPVQPTWLPPDLVAMWKAEAARRGLGKPDLEID